MFETGGTTGKEWYVCLSGSIQLDATPLELEIIIEKTGCALVNIFHFPTCSDSRTFPSEPYISDRLKRSG